MKFTGKFIIHKIRVLKVQTNSKQNKKSIIFRLIKDIFAFYPVMFPITIYIIFNAIISSIPAVFAESNCSCGANWQNGDWNVVGDKILKLVAVLVVFYVLS